MFRFFNAAITITVKRTPFTSLRAITSISPILQQKPTLPTVIKRYINNSQVLKDLLENPGKTLGEIHHAREGAGQYITIEKYNVLSEEDRKSLDDILFTYTGFYALDREFITVEQFLKLPVEARRLFDRLFCEAEERYWSAQRYRDNIDLIFEGEYLDLEKFAAMPHGQRKTLIKFLTKQTSYGLVGISMMQEGCFTINDFISYAPEQQQQMMELLSSVGQSGGWSTMEYRQLRDKVKALADVFNPTLTHQEEEIKMNDNKMGL